MVLVLCPTPGRLPVLHRASSRILRHREGPKCRIHVDGRNRASNIWIPTKHSDSAPGRSKDDANELLVKAGFIRQAYSGVFHMLPLGLRVQEKIERLIDKHMGSLGASKLSLSSISSQELWKKSGRLNDNSDVFRFLDRKGSRFLLAPTHEEEITSLVGSLVVSYKQTPVRLYQISRKYRDEPRPRQGLLRGREFIMKDLYTFDYNESEAMKSYRQVRSAYTKLFNELKVPYLVAEADSGNMGGSLSHEFVLPSERGEDTIVSCSNCGFVYNEEVADGRADGKESQCLNHASNFETDDGATVTAPVISNAMWLGISSDKRTLLRAWYPKYTMSAADSEPAERQASSHAVKAIAAAVGVNVDLSVENPLEQWAHQINSGRAEAKSKSQRPKVLDLYDSQVRAFKRPPLSDLLEHSNCSKNDIEYGMLDRFPGTENGLKIVKVHDNDQCPKCPDGTLTTHPAVELGHTFYLGTRYSGKLDARVRIPESLENPDRPSGNSKLVPLQMGCHGIGVSRMITAVADLLSDAKGLNWPRVIAPYEVIVLPMPGFQSEGRDVYDSLTSAQSRLDVLLDDRDMRPGPMLGDADVAGYPVIVVVGKGWQERQMLEVQCRRLNNLKVEIPLDQLAEYVQSLLQQL